MQFPPDIMPAYTVLGETVITASATFRDHAGLWWRTYSGGSLEELADPPTSEQSVASEGSPLV